MSLTLRSGDFEDQEDEIKYAVSNSGVYNGKPLVNSLSSNSSDDGITSNIHEKPLPSKSTTSTTSKNSSHAAYEVKENSMEAEDNTIGKEDSDEDDEDNDDESAHEAPMSHHVHINEVPSVALSAVTPGVEDEWVDDDDTGYFFVKITEEHFYRLEQVKHESR